MYLGINKQYEDDDQDTNSEIHIEELEAILQKDDPQDLPFSAPQSPAGRNKQQYDDTIMSVSQINKSIHSSEKSQDIDDKEGELQPPPMLQISQQVIQQDENEEEEEDQNGRDSARFRNTKKQRPNHNILVNAESYPNNEELKSARNQKSEIQYIKDAYETAFKKQYDRNEAMKKLNMILNKCREQIDEMNKHQNNDPNIQKLIKEADQIGIARKYSSFMRKEKHQHGLPLLFYLKRKEKLLTQKNPESLNYLNKIEDAQNKYKFGYVIQQDYLFFFVKKMSLINKILVINDKTSYLSTDELKSKSLLTDAVAFKLYQSKKMLKELGDKKQVMEKRIEEIIYSEFVERQAAMKKTENALAKLTPGGIVKNPADNNDEENKDENKTPQGIDSKAGKNNNQKNILKSKKTAPLNPSNGNVSYSHIPNQSVGSQLDFIDSKQLVLKQENDNESFYNKKVLLSIIQNQFFVAKEESIVLVLYLLSLDKKTNEHINLIWDKAKEYKFHSEFFKSFGVIRSADDLKNAMCDTKILARVIKLAISVNEPHIAIMAGKKLVDQNKQSEDRKILDYKNLIETMNLVFKNNRYDLIEKRHKIMTVKLNSVIPTLTSIASVNFSEFGTYQSDQVKSQNSNDPNSKLAANQQNLEEEERKWYFMELNREKELKERQLDLQERKLLQNKKKNIQSFIKFLRYFVKSDHMIQSQDVSTYFKKITKKPQFNSDKSLRSSSETLIVGDKDQYNKDDDDELIKLNFLVILKKTLELKKAYEDEKDKSFSKFEVEYFLKKLLKWELNQYLSGRMALQDMNNYYYQVMKVCIWNDKPYLAEMVIKKTGQVMNDKNENEILDENQCLTLFQILLIEPDCEKLELILEILKKIRSAKKALKHIYPKIVASVSVSISDIQDSIATTPESEQTVINYKSLLKKGKCIYYCAEMLALTDVKELDVHYSKEIALNLVKFCKSSQLKQCHTPYLTLILIAEFLKKLAKADVLHQNIIQSTLTTVLELTLCLQKSVKNEKKFKYMHQVKDLMGREALDIIVENQFYELLQNDEIGMIAEDLWRGPPSISIWNFSRIKQFLSLEIFDDQVQLFKKFEKKDQQYIFQFDNWKSSCEHRYIAEAFSICSLALFYQMIVYIQIQNNTLDQVPIDESIIPFQRLAQVWIISTFFSQILQLVYSLKTRKKFQIDHWRIIDLLQFIMIIIDALNIHAHFFPEKNDKYYEGDEDGNLNVYYRHMLNASIISLIVFLVWFRIISVLITTQRLGHMIQAIYFMIKMTLNFLIIFACWLICSAAIFTAIYYDSGSSNDSYRSFSVTITTLFSASLAVYDDEFTILEPLGSIMLSIYVVISAVMLINLLIALLTEAFSAISKHADSRHRAILINYRHRWAWQDTHSYLIFVPPPINMLAFLLLPFGLFLSKSKMQPINQCFCKTLFFIIYVIPMIIVFFFSNLLLIVFAYFKGFYTLKSIILKDMPIVNFILWTIFGPLLLLYVIFKDIAIIISVSIESLAIRTQKNEKNNMSPEQVKLMKSIKLNNIYKNFIKSIIRIFDEIEFIKLEITNKKEKDLQRKQNLLNKLEQKENKNKVEETKNKCENQADVKNFTSRFYRLLEDKETHQRNIKNPARALKGKRKKRPKIFQNFIEEKSREIQLDLMKCYFHKKYSYNAKLIFERAYYADFGAIDKAIHKFKQKSALQKQGQNLKKINEHSGELKESLSDFNNKGNLDAISVKLITIMQEKLLEANEIIEQQEEDQQTSDSSNSIHTDENDEDEEEKKEETSKQLDNLSESLMKFRTRNKIFKEYNDQNAPPIPELNQFNSMGPNY